VTFTSMLSLAGMFEHLTDLALAHAACMSHRTFGLPAVVDQLHVGSARARTSQQSSEVASGG